MAEDNPEDLIGRTFLLPPNQKGEHHRALIKQKVIELSDHLDSTHDKNVNKINLLLDVGQGRSQAVISYNQVLNYIKKLPIKKMIHFTSSGLSPTTMTHLSQVTPVIMVASIMS